jgi:hypothetical protein
VEGAAGRVDGDGLAVGEAEWEGGYRSKEGSKYVT